MTEPDAKLPKVNLMLALARCGEAAQAAKLAAEMVEKPPQESHLHFQAACGYALAAGASSDPSLAKQYTSAAVACLQKGKQAGWSDLVSLKINPDLEPIREAPEFRALIAEFNRPK